MKKEMSGFLPIMRNLIILMTMTYLEQRSPQVEKVMWPKVKTTDFPGG